MTIMDMVETSGSIYRHISFLVPNCCFLCLSGSVVLLFEIHEVLFVKITSAATFSNESIFNSPHMVLIGGRDCVLFLAK